MSRRCWYKKRHFFGDKFAATEETHYTRESAKKYKRRDEDFDVPIDVMHTYFICNFFILFTQISDLTICKECHKKVKFRPYNYSGFGFEIEMSCKCGTTILPSSPFIDENYEINRRIVFVMRLLGVGLKGINMFSALMDMGSSFSDNLYNTVLDNVKIASKAVFKVVTRKALEEEKKENVKHGEPLLQLSASSSETWKKIGSDKLYGITTLNGKYTNLILSTKVKSAICKLCTNRKKENVTSEYRLITEDHPERPNSNTHAEILERIELSSVCEMFQEAEEKYGVTYANYVSEIDTQDFDYMYNNQLVRRNKMFVNHIETLMVNRLHTVKDNTKGISENDGGELSDKIIVDLTKYFDLAIRHKYDSAEEMRNAIWAAFYHKSSSDEDPQHQFCPKGMRSWCKYRIAEATGKLRIYKHENPPLNRCVLNQLKPIYDYLTADTLLQRYIEINIEMGRENLSSIIWALASRELRNERESLVLATHLGVCIHNYGYAPILKILNVMGVRIGLNAQTFVVQRDNEQFSLV